MLHRNDGTRDRLFGEEIKHVSQGKTVLFGQRDVETVIGGRGLQLKIETAAEAFPQCQAPGLVNPAAEGCMQDQLHSPALVKESLGDDGIERGHCSQHGAAGHDVADHLLCGRTFSPSA